MMYPQLSHRLPLILAQASNAAGKLRDVLGTAVFIIQVISAVACMAFLIGAIIKAKREQSFEGVGFSVFVAVACAASWVLVTIIWNAVGVNMDANVTAKTSL
jgi:hypothetical protein